MANNKRAQKNPKSLPEQRNCAYPPQEERVSDRAKISDYIIFGPDKLSTIRSSARVRLLSFAKAGDRIVWDRSAPVCPLLKPGASFVFTLGDSARMGYIFQQKYFGGRSGLAWGFEIITCKNCEPIAKGVHGSP